MLLHLSMEEDILSNKAMVVIKVPLKALLKAINNLTSNLISSLHKVMVLLHKVTALLLNSSKRNLACPLV
jgi:hypothetical protein